MNFPENSIRRPLPAATALLLFFVVSAAYFAPQFRGEALPQHDVIQYEGMTRDILQTRQQSGEDPQWTGGMFGGMPAYLINVAYPAQLVKRTVGQAVKVLDTPASFLFFAMTAMWLMLLMMGIDPWVGIVPALAYGLSTYFLLIIGAGHITKMWALVYAPLMMGGAWVTLRGDVRYGAVLTALAASLEIGAGHPQITYYFLLAMGALWLSDGIVALREKRLRNFGLRTAALAAAGMLAVASNFAPLWYTARHTKETIRGGSELAATAENRRGGLDPDYATAWSYGKAETLNLLVPDFMGRDSGTTFAADGEVAAVTEELGLRGIARQLPAYWGTQPYTGGPTYLGAAAIFLAALGLGLARGRNKWWIAGISLLMILLAWGRNLMGLTEAAFRLLPGYDKFRTVSMTLVIVQWTVPLSGALALGRLWRDEIPKQRLLRTLAWAAGITGGLCLLLAVAGSALFDFGRDESAAMMTDQYRRILEANDLQTYVDRGFDMEWGEATADAMATERASMMQADAWRSLMMILLAAGSVALYAWRKIGKYALVAVLAGVMLLDLVPVDLRFLSSDDFVPARQRHAMPTAADKAILADTDPGYRVINLTVSPFNDATTSYFHRSVGGYHGAKLARYQDLIDRYLSVPDEKILDLLNTRYAIVPGPNGQPEARYRGTEYGPAWFVEKLVRATGAREEIEALGQIDLRTTAVVSGGAAATDADTDTAADADTDMAGEITLTEYRPNYLKYEYAAPAEAVAVFSEIYYDKGWTAYVDGEEAPYFRADYVLRAMRLPAGNHTVEWRFRAPGWKWTEGITLAASLAILAGALAALVLRLRERASRKER
ncbi:MAG: YfhO family protein [Alistipes sp.]|nr:YfhO family protein [Alistipes senegalensis]MCM1250999.1 YfhO family protein [Alistipes sp.]